MDRVVGRVERRRRRRRGRRVGRRTAMMVGVERGRWGIHPGVIYSGTWERWERENARGGEVR